MSQYAPYLFQKPLIEENNDYNILNNYTDEELNNLYWEFMIETFGEYILNEDYYNFIINKYGEDIINEGFLDSIKSFFGFGGSKPAVTQQKPKIPSITPEQRAMRRAEILTANDNRARIASDLAAAKEARLKREEEQYGPNYNTGKNDTSSGSSTPVRQAPPTQPTGSASSRLYSNNRDVVSSVPNRSSTVSKARAFMRSDVLQGLPNQIVKKALNDPDGTLYRTIQREKMGRDRAKTIDAWQSSYRNRQN